MHTDTRVGWGFQVEAAERERALEVGVIAQNYAHMMAQNAGVATRLTALKAQVETAQAAAAELGRAKGELETEVGWDPG